jgi:hypothetical protein
MKMKYNNDLLQIIYEPNFDKRLEIAAKALAKGVYIQTIKRNNADIYDDKYTDEDKKNIKKNIINKYATLLKFHDNYHTWEQNGDNYYVKINADVLENYDSSCFYTLFKERNHVMNYRLIMSFFVFTNSQEERQKMFNFLYSTMRQKPKKEKRYYYYDDSDDEEENELRIKRNREIYEWRIAERNRRGIV